MAELPATDWLNMLRLGLVVAALGLVVLAAVIDVRKFIIPNWLNAALLALGLVFAVASTFHAAGFNWVTHLACFILFFAAGTLLFAAGLLGGGDVKLFSVLAFWAGPAYLAPMLVYSAAAGGVLSLVYLAKAWAEHHGLIVRKVIAVQPDLPHTDSDVTVAPLGQQSFLKTPVPYGVAIAVGGVYVFASITGQLR